MQPWPLFWLIIILTLLSGACKPDPSQTVEALVPQPTRRAQLIKPTSTLEVSGASDMLTSSEATLQSNPPPETCPVTQAPEPLFRPPLPYPPVAPYPNEFWYGTDSLWTMLPTDGTWRGLPYTDGHYSQKIFWWREGYDGQTEPEPKLMIVIKRLDGPAPIIETGPPASNAYHPDFNWAMLTGVGFPTLGCWEITGSYGSYELSFVVWVTEATTKSNLPSPPPSSPTQSAPASLCPVTEPVWVKPPDDPAVDDIPGYGYYYVNQDRSIWVAAWWTGLAENYLRAGEEGIKTGWFRPAGAELDITGQRLDGPAPPLHSHVPCCYPTRFQATGLMFPTEGCWQVKAKAADRELSFVVRVDP